jgi:hypothetical protein
MLTCSGSWKLLALAILSFLFPSSVVNEPSV